jgi:catechol 2,3-dioxygenase-like lactoylglutathione lyase family enzyme
MHLKHLHLMVKDIKISQKFYQDLFGFKEKIWYGDDLLFLQNSDGFDLALTPCDKVVPLPKGVHYGFTVTDSSFLENLYKNGKNAFPDCFQKAPANYGDWGTLICQDPDGYNFEIYWDKNLHN